MKSRSLILIGLIFLFQVTQASETIFSSFQNRLLGFRVHFNYNNKDLTEPLELSMDKISPHHNEVIEFWSALAPNTDLASQPVLATTKELGLDILSLKELNISAAQIWNIIGDCYQGNFENFRQDYFIGLPQCEQAVPMLQELNQKLFAVLISTSLKSYIVSSAWHSTRVPPRALAMHPLLMQFMIQYMASIKLMQSLGIWLEASDLNSVMLTDVEKEFSKREELDKNRGLARQLMTQYFNTAGIANIFANQKIAKELEKVNKWLLVNDPYFKPNGGYDDRVKEKDRAYRLRTSGDPYGSFYESIKMLVFLAMKTSQATRQPFCHVLGLAPVQNLVVLQYWDGQFPLQREQSIPNLYINTVQGECGFVTKIIGGPSADSLDVQSLRNNLNVSHLRQLSGLHRLYFHKLVIPSSTTGGLEKQNPAKKVSPENY